MRRSKYNIMSIVVVATLAINSPMVYATSTDSIQNKIDKNNETIKDIENQRDNIKDEKNKQQNELDSLLGKIGEEGNKLTSITMEVNKYQKQIDDMQAEIDKVQNNIKSIQDEVEQKKLLIAQKEQEEKDTQEKLGKRIRSYYKTDMTNQYVYMIIKSESISKLFDNIQSVFRIMSLDKELIDTAKSIKDELVKENKILDEKLVKIKEEQGVLVAKQNEVKEAQKVVLAKQAEQQSKYDELATLENQKQSLLASLQNKDNELADAGHDLVANNEALEAQLQEILNNINNGSNNGGSNPGNGGNSGSGNGSNNGGNTGGGTPGDPSQETFMRPGSGPVTDTYGHRTNPVTGKPEYHKGVDLGDPEGAPVHAAKSGTVSYSGWMSGYGNTVIIDHGNGVQTLYGHNSALQVSVGQQVSQGQTIANVGSTGQVTGPHIHWEIRVNGQPTDPMAYV